MSAGDVTIPVRERAAAPPLALVLQADDARLEQRTAPLELGDVIGRVLIPGLPPARLETDTPAARLEGAIATIDATAPARIVR